MKMREDFKWDYDLIRIRNERISFRINERNIDRIEGRENGITYYYYIITMHSFCSHLSPFANSSVVITYI